MAATTGEKIVKLEVQMADVSAQVSKLDVKVERVLTKLDDISNLKNEIENLKEEVTTLKAKTFRNGWIFPSLSAILGSILTFLIIEYLRGGRL